MSVPNLNSVSTSPVTAPAAAVPSANQANQPGQAPPATADTAAAALSSQPESPSGTPILPGNAAQTQTQAATRAVLVALESFITAGLDELGQMLSTRAALIDKLPPEIKELVKNILTAQTQAQTQTDQAVLPAGLADLLKSPRTSAEKLVLLANIMDEAAGLADMPGGQPAGGTVAGRQQVLQALVRAWNDGNPEQLTAAAKTLRELANTIQAAGQPAGQAQPPTAGTQSGQAAAGRQQLPLPTGSLPAGQAEPLTPGTQAGSATAGRQQSPSPAGQPAGAAVPPAAQTLPEQPAALPPAGQPAAQQQEPAAMPLRQPAGQQVPTAPGQPQPEFLPGQQAGKAAANGQLQPAGQPGMPAEPARPLPADGRQQGNAAPARPQHPPTGVAPNPDAPAARQQDPTAPLLLKTLAARPEVLKSLPPEIRDLVQSLAGKAEMQEQAGAALPDSLAALFKSAKPAVEKITMLAAFLEEAAAIIKPSGRQTAQTAAGGQQVQADVFDAWQNKSQAEQKAVAAVIRELAESVPKAGNMLVERQERHNVLSFTVPLYFGDGQAAYPAHIHVYHQQEEDKKNPGQRVAETWLRVCLETENIGTVETAFHLYDGETLDVKVRFADEEAAAGFNDSVADVKAQLDKLPFQLGEFLVR